MSVKEDNYKLIGAFVENKLSPEEFVKAFLDTYLNEKRDFSDDLFFILDELFVYAHEYTTDAELLAGHPDTYFSEPQLRGAAQAAFEKLRALKE